MRSGVYNKVTSFVDKVNEIKIEAQSHVEKLRRIKNKIKEIKSSRFYTPDKESVLGEAYCLFYGLEPNNYLSSSFLPSYCGKNVRLDSNHMYYIIQGVDHKDYTTYGIICYLDDIFDKVFSFTYHWKYLYRKAVFDGFTELSFDDFYEKLRTNRKYFDEVLDKFFCSPSHNKTGFSYYIMTIGKKEILILTSESECFNWSNKF